MVKPAFLPSSSRAQMGFARWKALYNILVVELHILTAKISLGVYHSRGQTPATIRSAYELANHRHLPNGNSTGLCWGVCGR